MRANGPAACNAACACAAGCADLCRWGAGREQGAGGRAKRDVEHTRSRWVTLTLSAEREIRQLF